MTEVRAELLEAWFNAKRLFNFYGVEGLVEFAKVLFENCMTPLVFRFFFCMTSQINCLG